MAANETDNQTKPIRPSWETAAPPAQPAALRPLPPPVSPPVSASPPVAYVPPAFPVSNPDVQYDLAGNPVAASVPLPGSVVPGPAVPSTWPPPPSAPSGGAWLAGENGTDRVARLKWNWGAFMIPFWWSLSNGQRNLAGVIFLTNLGDRFVPAPFGYAFTAAQLGLMIYLGVMGHRLAWSSDRFAGDYDHFIRTQRAWMIWGWVLLGLGITGFILIFTLVPGASQAILSGQKPSGGPSRFNP